GQDDPRPRAGDPGAEEIPGHEHAGAWRGGARRPVRDLLLHRAGERGTVPGHAAARRLLQREDRPGAEGVGRWSRPSVHGPGPGIALPEGRVLQGPVATTACSRSGADPASPTIAELAMRQLLPAAT